MGLVTGVTGTDDTGSTSDTSGSTSDTSGGSGRKVEVVYYEENMRGAFEEALLLLESGGCARGDCVWISDCTEFPLNFQPYTGACTGTGTGTFAVDMFCRLQQNQVRASPPSPHYAGLPEVVQLQDLQDVRGKGEYEYEEVHEQELAEIETQTQQKQKQKEDSVDKDIRKRSDFFPTNV